MYSLVDKFFTYLLSLNESDEKDYAETRKNISHIEHILYDMDIIDNKSSALLTHVSVMLAVVIGMLFTLVEVKEGFLYYVLIIEVAAYAVVAMFLLRCVDVMGPPFRLLKKQKKELDIQYHQEIVLRRSIYQLMSRIVFILTFILTFILVLITFFKIFNII